ncbi:MAG: RHS repeat-associated core domain-containing protein [Acidobacteria bacterium]|nr:RHS repeat-associated core domain-containing protein [Acidobacteriota bacterium]MBS1866827.1 RHS repeat-associated core domain-containing protein [Acidobacteriota bacterium]
MSRIQTSTACPTNYKFTGYERDPETGLDYAFARYYSSRLGRFLSTDPLGGAIGSLQSHNAYSYTANNPLNFVDPSGMHSCDDDPKGINNCPPIMRGWGQAGGGDFSGWSWFDFFDVDVEGNWFMIRGAWQFFLLFGTGASSELRLQVDTDCVLANGVRNIRYGLVDQSGHVVNNYYVTEHQTDTSLASSAAGPGTSVDPPGPYPVKTPFSSGFNDFVGGAGTHNSKQTFTVSLSPPGNGVKGVPVTVRGLDGHDYGELGIYIDGGKVFVNGKQSDKICN